MFQRASSSSVTIEQVLERICATIKPASATYYRNALDNWKLPQGLKTPLDRITAETVERFRDRELKRGLAPRSVVIRLSSMSRVFSSAIKLGLHHGENPCAKIDRPQVRHKESGFYTLDEVTELLKAVRNESRPTLSIDGIQATPALMADVVVLLYSTGLRRGELGRLKVGDIQGDWLQVDGKMRPRRIPLCRLAKGVLARWAGNIRDTTKPLFPVQSHEDWLSKAFSSWNYNRLSAPYKGRFKAHCFRHSFRTLLAEKDVPNHIADAVMGHVPATMGARYTHASPSSILAAIKAVFDRINI